MEINELLAEQFASCNNQKNWFAPLQSALEGLTAVQASMKTENGEHSIWQIVSHLYYWNERLLLRFKGMKPKESMIDNNATFDAGNSEVTEASWRLLVEKTTAMMDEFESEILNCDQEKMMARVSDEISTLWYAFLSQTNIHNAYHIGQIVLIRKMHEDWDVKRNGVS
jgi:hypothetical protein